MVEVEGESVRPSVAFVVPDRNDSYQVSVVGDILRRRVLAAGFGFTQLTLVKGADGIYDLSPLEPRLADPGLVVVEMFGIPQISRAVVAAGRESVVVARDGSPDYRRARVVRFTADDAVREFAARCRAAGVRSVLQVGFEYGFADAAAALAAEGISVDLVCVPAPDISRGVIADVKRSTLSFFSKFFARGGTLPDLVYFADDHAAEAGFLALALAGVRVPRDVRVASWSNCGLAPVYATSVARLAMDPFANGEALSEYVVALLRGGAPAQPPELAARYVPGDTFPEGDFSTENPKKGKGSKKTQWKS